MFRMGSDQFRNLSFRGVFARRGRLIPHETLALPRHVAAPLPLESLRNLGHYRNYGQQYHQQLDRRRHAIEKVLAHARIATSKNALSEAAPDASAQTIAAR